LKRSKSEEDFQMSKQVITANGEVLQYVPSRKFATRETPEQEASRKHYEGGAAVVVQASNAARDRAITLNWLRDRGVPEEILLLSAHSPKTLALLVEGEARKAAAQNAKRPLRTQTNTLRTQNNNDAPPAPPKVLTK
jgi:hypothetical protein